MKSKMVKQNIFILSSHNFVRQMVCTHCNKVHAWLTLTSG